ncbi:LytR family transcriptional regulator [Cytobacillus firmus]|uniref:LytR family transcriptional regulator n=1 Tax=Cytobacillus firmus TaxID=1399 RepID=UPI0018CECA6B|nr:LytR family transcriptional regulator [Cytobacillus firmus]
MKDFDAFPKSIKKALRYIQQDIKSLEKLECIEQELFMKINKRKRELRDRQNVE